MMIEDVNKMMQFKCNIKSRDCCTCTVYV